MCACGQNTFHTNDCDCFCCEHPDACGPDSHPDWCECMLCTQNHGLADEPSDGFMTDAEADAVVLRSAGWGTDEDYGYFGDSEMTSDD